MTELKATTMKSLQQEWTAWELTDAPSRIKKKEMYSLAKEIRRIAKIQEQQLSIEEIAFVRMTSDFPVIRDQVRAQS